MALAVEALTATGWAPVDETNRYWRHASRYGPDATFDVHEVETIEGNRRERGWEPRRALPCRCRLPYGRLEERVCWACGRWVA